MLKEITAEIRKEHNRRWFTDDYIELIVWIDQETVISDFQLCYDVKNIERAFTWTKARGFTHVRVDEGEENATRNSTPILVPAGLFPVHEILEQFLARSAEIDARIRSFVVYKLNEYSGQI